MIEIKALDIKALDINTTGITINNPIDSMSNKLNLVEKEISNIQNSLLLLNKKGPWKKQRQKIKKKYRR